MEALPNDEQGTLSYLMRKEVMDVISRVSDAHDHLMDAYPKAGLSALARFFEEISRQFTDYRLARNRKFYEFVMRSESRTSAVREVAEQAKNIAKEFEKYSHDPSLYSAVDSRLEIMKLQAALENLLTIVAGNEYRSDGIPSESIGEWPPVIRAEPTTLFKYDESAQPEPASPGRDQFVGHETETPDQPPDESAQPVSPKQGRNGAKARKQPVRKERAPARKGAGPKEDISEDSPFQFTSEDRAAALKKAAIAIEKQQATPLKVDEPPYDVAQAIPEDDLVPYQLPSYDSDQSEGEDYLNIEQDVEAFASLICARKTLPPLSIGLFGEWGSGKTFFMRKLRNRVGEISLDARRSGRLQKDIAYYKRVVQIEFNAWHYAEGNLWASLVEHILANLCIQGEKQNIIENLQKKLLLQLADQKLDQAKAQEDVTAAQNKLASLTQELDDKKSEFQQVTNELTDLKAQDVLHTVFASPDIRAGVGALQANFAELGISELAVGGKDFLTALEELRQTLRRGGAILLPFVNSPQRTSWILLFLLLLVLAPVIGLGIGWLVAKTGNADLSQYSTWITTILGWMGVIAGTARTSAKWVSDRIAPIEQLKKQIDDRVAQKQSEINVQIADLEKQKVALEQEKQEALQKQEAAEKNVVLTQEKLDQATPARMLANFIQDRVQSNDYRKHLGVLALVRNDFEKLSDFIGHENTECEGFETLEQEAKDADSRINRIVLFIDDLDRCSTRKVIQVLQAVHLLLAFPLFVVVVAVDARWISGALYEQYGSLLRPKAAVPDQATDEDELLGATALDYLEKIFQIPFWLSPMNEGARKTMIEGLVKVTSSEGRSETAMAPVGAVTPNAAAPDQAPREQKQELVSPPVDEAPAPTTPPEPVVDLNPAALTITAAEHEFIDELCPLLGRSPRALKRFVNVYRLIKSSVPDERKNTFISGSDGEFRLAMFLLAIVTHAPEFSQEFFGALYKFRQEKPKATGLKAADWKRLFGAGIDPTLSREQTHLIRWIQTPEAKPIREASLARLIWWARRTARFAFLLEPAVAEWLSME